MNYPYKTGVIDTLVAEIQNVPGEDRCVLMLGYTEQMEEFVKKSNPGLSRRFALDDAFMFNDYSDEELMQILNLKIQSKGLTADFDAQYIFLDMKVEVILTETLVCIVEYINKESY